MKNIDELEAFMLKHGENIVDMMGAEIDRIEMKLRVSKLIPRGTQTFIITLLKLALTLIFIFAFLFALEQALYISGILYCSLMSVVLCIVIPSSLV